MPFLTLSIWWLSVSFASFSAGFLWTFSSRRTPVVSGQACRVYQLLKNLVIRRELYREGNLKLAPPEIEGVRQRLIRKTG